MRHVRNIATTIGVIATLALLAMWWRSYTTHDRIEGWLWGGDAAIVTSKQGCVGVMKFAWPGADDEWEWGWVRISLNNPSADPVEEMSRINHAGFGRLDSLHYVITPPMVGPDGVVMGGLDYFIRGKGYIVPYWFLILLCLASTLATRWRGRFTVRGMLIGTGVVAVLIVIFKIWVFGESDEPLPP
ncbi:hypothetical protein [Aeoliella sp. SH292]|uniref:hypothetical protein n=1 Tax=Aeoliella sp. SH292 TaxID=3454464 RepID=UPI003F98179F